MDYFSIILGVLAFAFGFYTITSRKKKDYNSARLEAMKSMFGEKKGDTVHLVFYGIVPFILGLMMFLKAFGLHL